MKAQARPAKSGQVLAAGWWMRTLRRFNVVACLNPSQSYSPIRKDLTPWLNFHCQPAIPRQLVNNEVVWFNILLVTYLRREHHLDGQASAKTLALDTL